MKQVICSLDYKFCLTLLVLVVAVLGGVLMNQLALALQQASLVFAMEGFQTFFVFSIAIFFTIFFPRILKEKFDLKNLILKLVALMFMVVGIVVLNIKW